MADKLGWILVHSSKAYDDEENYDTPQEELAADYSSGMLWHWKLAHPLKEGGPYTLLFAWKGEIFGEAAGHVTHQIEGRGTLDYNFAFKLDDYEDIIPVKLDDLKIRPCHSLVALTPEILQKYRKLASSK